MSKKTKTWAASTSRSDARADLRRAIGCGCEGGARTCIDSPVAPCGCACHRERAVLDHALAMEHGSTDFSGLPLAHRLHRAYAALRTHLLGQALDSDSVADASRHFLAGYDARASVDVASGLGTVLAVLRESPYLSTDDARSLTQKIASRLTWLGGDPDRVVDRCPTCTYSLRFSHEGVTVDMSAGHTTDACLAGARGVVRDLRAHLDDAWVIFGRSMRATVEQADEHCRRLGVQTLSDRIAAEALEARVQLGKNP